MKIALSRLAAPAAMLLSAPLIAVSATASEPENKDQEQAETEKAGKESSAIVIPEVKEEKRICRRVKLDMSSRRGTKVCKTADEWREFNQRR